MIVQASPLLLVSQLHGAQPGWSVPADGTPDGTPPMDGVTPRDGARPTDGAPSVCTPLDVSFGKHEKEGAPLSLDG